MECLGSVVYLRIDDSGLHTTVAGAARVFDVDDVIICAGQEPERSLLEPLVAMSVEVQLLGGADVATELDAERAILQATEIAMAI